MEKESIVLDENSNWLNITQEILSIFGENIFKLLILLIFYLAVSLPQEHFHINLFDTIFDTTALQQDPLNLLQALLESDYSSLLNFNITFSVSAIFYLVLLTTKFMIILSFLKIIHEDSSVVFAFIYSLKETIYFIIDRTIAALIIYSPLFLLFFLISKKINFLQLFFILPGYGSLILIGAAIFISYYAIRFGKYIYNLLCEKINYQAPQSTEILRLSRLYFKGHVLRIIFKFLALATLVFVLQFLLFLISFSTKEIIYGISADSLVSMIFDFFSAEFYLVAFYLIFQIYRNKFEKNFKDSQLKETI